MARRQIGVIGAGECPAEVYELARAVGREIARRGHILVCGGLGGVMEGACRGAREEGGLTVGVLPSSRISDANPWVEVAIATGMGEARNAIVVHSSEGLIAIAGGYGTLSEVAIALKVGKPVVALESFVLEGVTLASDPIEAVSLLLRAMGEE